MRGNKRFDGSSIGWQGSDLLGERLYAFQRCRAQWVTIKGFPYGLGKLNGLRGFQNDGRQVFDVVVLRDFHAIGGVRVDHDLMVLPNLANGRQAISMGAAARHKTKLGQAFHERGGIQVKRAAGINGLP